MKNNPTHGPLTCTRCFNNDRKLIEANGWRLVNDPGLWGSSDPSVLILGQSKGNTQIRKMSENDFDAVAFAGIRDRLARILARISLNLDAENLDQHFSKDEKDFAFASVLRCSLSDPTGKTSGSPVMHAMDDPEADRWIVNCMDQWLSKPNPRLKIVVFLGLTDGYAKRIATRLLNLHSATFRKVSSTIFEAAGVSWVFAQHPSRISENHYQNWIGNLPHAKRDLVNTQILKKLT